MPERTKSHRVEWGETDAAGIVFYPNYYRWFDQASHDLFRELGLPVRELAEKGFAIPLIDSGGRFLGSLAYDDEVQITSRISETRTRSFRVDHTVKNAKGAVVCEAYEVRIWVRLGEEQGKLRPERIPDSIRALISGK